MIIFVRDNFNYYRDDDFFQALIKKYVPVDEFDKIDRDFISLIIVRISNR